MTDLPQSTAGLVDRAGASILEVGVVGALLLLSLIGNAWLIWLLVRCYNRSHGFMKGDYDA